MNSLFNNKYGICNSLIGLIIIFSLSIVPSFAADVKNSKDHPLIPRYEGSSINFYKAEAFNEFPLLIDGIKSGRANNNPDSVKWLEGKITSLMYVTPSGRSILEVMRNYEKALADAGFEVLFSCNKEACNCKNGKCDSLSSSFFITSGGQHNMKARGLRYLAAKLSRSEGDVYVSLLVTSHKYDTPKGWAWLRVIEIEPMEEKMVTIDAAEMNKGIDKEGRVALYGILFDVNKDTIKPESKPTLEQITALLTNNPEMKIVIVGHTDNQGELKYNMDLSTRRAKSVKAALISDYGIAKERLSAWGVGYLSPVASNRTEAGQTKNRRVELVEQ